MARALRNGLWALALACCTPGETSTEPTPSGSPPPENDTNAMDRQEPVAEPAPASNGEKTPDAAAAAKPAAAAITGDQAAQVGHDILDGDRFIGTERALDDLTTALGKKPLSGLEPVGSTSTVFRARMRGPDNAAFKAPTKKRPRGPTAEIAAYRMARLLGLTNVPPAVSRSLSVVRLKASLHANAAAQWPEIAPRLLVRGGKVDGVAIHWIPRLTHLNVDRPAGIRRWTAWLRNDGEIPPEQRGLAASVSTMLVFDYLIGNWDRWSGGNAKGHASGSHLYFRDHDVAFPARLPPRMHRRMVDRLLKAERFSKRMHQRLAALTRERFEQELALDPAGDGLLSETQVRNVFDRRSTILSHVGALIEQHGPDRVLVFP